jgi:recombination protein RecA
MAKEAEAKAADINAAKLKALQATIDKIEKDYGKGTIMKLGDQPQWDVQVIPSGSVALDHALGIGGYPRGRIIEIYGPESSGKTTLAIHAIAQAQKTGGIAAMIDAEHAFDRTYAKALGVNLETLLISQPDNGEQALEIADNLIDCWTGLGLRVTGIDHVDELLGRLYMRILSYAHRNGIKLVYDE